MKNTHSYFTRSKGTPPPSPGLHGIAECGLPSTETLDELNKAWAALQSPGLKLDQTLSPGSWLTLSQAQSPVSSADLHDAHSTHSGPYQAQSPALSTDLQDAHSTRFSPFISTHDLEKDPLTKNPDPASTENMENSHLQSPARRALSLDHL